MAKFSVPNNNPKKVKNTFLLQKRKALFAFKNSIANLKIYFSNIPGLSQHDSNQLSQIAEQLVTAAFYGGEKGIKIAKKSIE